MENVDSDDEKDNATKKEVRRPENKPNLTEDSFTLVFLDTIGAPVTFMGWDDTDDAVDIRRSSDENVLLDVEVNVMSDEEIIIIITSQKISSFSFRQLQESKNSQRIQETMIQKIQSNRAVIEVAIDDEFS